MKELQKNTAGIFNYKKSIWKINTFSTKHLKDLSPIILLLWFVTYGVLNITLKFCSKTDFLRRNSKKTTEEISNIRMSFQRKIISIYNTLNSNYIAGATSDL